LTSFSLSFFENLYLGSFFYSTILIKIVVFTLKISGFCAITLSNLLGLINPDLSQKSSSSPILKFGFLVYSITHSPLIISLLYIYAPALPFSTRSSSNGS
jgi:hypothetical protein